MAKTNNMMAMDAVEARFSEMGWVAHDSMDGIFAVHKWVKDGATYIRHRDPCMGNYFYTDDKNRFLHPGQVLTRMDKGKL